MLPKVNESLYMQVNSIDPEEANKVYKARIADIQGSYMSIEVPLEVGTGKLKRLYAGDQISAYFITGDGVKHYFDSPILGFKEETIRLVVIRLPEAEKITKVQRRSFLRVPAELEIAVKTGSFAFTALTEDVSGGGVSFLCDVGSALQTHDSLSCWLLLPFRNGAIEHACFKGEVVRVKQLENGKQLVMLQFIEIADAERQRVIRYCFERQFDVRKQ